MIPNYSAFVDMISSLNNSRDGGEIRKHFFEPWKLSDEDRRQLCENVPLTEKYMREFAKWLNWDILSEHQIMSKEFIREMKGKVNWHIILSKEKWDENFIDENSKYITNKRKPLKNELCWENIFQNNIRSKKFFYKYYENLNWKEIFDFASIKGGQIFNTYKDYIRNLKLYEKYMSEDKFEMIVPTNFWKCCFKQTYDLDFAGNQIYYKP